MDDDFDIYGDLDHFKSDVDKENKIIKDLNDKIAELKSKIAEKESEKQEFSKKNEILLENISSLLVTAKAELNRKDAIIADIRRENDNSAFRRRGPGGGKNVRRYEKATQTRNIRLVENAVQTEWNNNDLAPDCKSQIRGRKRSRSRDQIRSRPNGQRRSRSWNRKELEICRSRDQRRSIEESERNDRIRDRRREMWMNHHRSFDRNRLQSNRVHEDEREKEKIARRGPRTPDRSRKRSPVRFPSPVRIRTDSAGIHDSASDDESSRPFIPKNKVELDRYVKDMGRCHSPSSSRFSGARNRKKIIKRDISLETNESEMWDSHIGKELPESRNSLASGEIKKKKLSKKKITPQLIQSDEIGTTALGSTSSPKTNEELEQKMIELLGEPVTPAAPLVEGPQTVDKLLENLNASQPSNSAEPLTTDDPIDDDDAKLNDSRELRIVEIEEIIPSEQSEHQLDPVQENPIVPVVGELEEGEVVTPVSSPNVERCNEQITSIVNLDCENANENVGNCSSPMKETIHIIPTENKDESEIAKPSHHAENSSESKDLLSISTESSSETTNNVKNTSNDSIAKPVRSSNRRRTIPRKYSVEQIMPKSRPSNTTRSSENKKTNNAKKTEKIAELFGLDDENSSTECTQPHKKLKVSPPHNENERCEDESPHVPDESASALNQNDSSEITVECNDIPPPSSNTSNGELIEQCASENKPTEPPQVVKALDVIVISSSYKEYRMEVDNEEETTFYVTRKKRKSKTKNKGLV